VGKIESLGERLWRIRFEMERLRNHGDTSLMWLGDLANTLEEYDVGTVAELRIHLDGGDVDGSG